LDLVLVANGINEVDAIQDLSIERWQSVMDVHVKAGRWVCKAAARQMIKQGRGGKVVLVSSTRGKLGHPAGYSAYCTAKSAIDGLVRALACEWGKHRININAIGPTVFRSPLSNWMFAAQDPGKAVREDMLKRIPIGRLGEPEDLIGPLLYPLSPASDFMTGQILYVDGGYTAG
jgi:NAD(P)-dependent dehydrogenase (short-subunit alcohol dehydrogenase family)